MTANTDTEPADTTPELPKPGQPRILDRSRVEHIPLSKVDLDDRTFMFRAALRVGPLKDSIEADGLQVPIIVHPCSDSGREIA
jgi:hypothetical protein